MLRFVIPKKSSLSEPLRRFLSIAGYPLGEGDVTDVVSNGVCFSEAGRRSIPALIAQGAFDAGVTGYDLYLNSGEELRAIAQLRFSRSSARPVCWELACKQGWEPREDQVKIVTELPRLAKRLLDDANVTFAYTIEEIDGTEELWVKRGLAECVFVVTETGRSMARNGLTVVPGVKSPLLVSTPRIFARAELAPGEEEDLQNLAFALKSVVDARTRIMVTFDIHERNLQESLQLPSAVAPTIARLDRDGWRSVSICIPRCEYGPIGRRIQQAGGLSIVMQNIDGYCD